MFRALRAFRVIRQYTYRSRNFVPVGNLGDFQTALESKTDGILPPLEKLNISSFVPEKLTTNILQNDEALYFGARRKEDQINVGIEIRFNVLEAEWLDDETKRKIYKYNLEIPVIDINGELAITKDDSRYRMKNLKLALKELEVFIKKCQTESWSRRIDGHRDRQNFRKESVQTFRSLSWIKDPNFS